MCAYVFFKMFIFYFKIMGEKRSSAKLGDKDDCARGRVKMRDLESVCRSEGEVFIFYW